MVRFPLGSAVHSSACPMALAKGAIRGPVPLTAPMME